METSRVLVTGGAGFIGTNLVNELRGRGQGLRPHGQRGALG